MGSLIDLTKQAFGLAPIAPTRMDLKLLPGTTDTLGRTLPMSGLSVLGTGGVQWLGSEGSDLTRNGYTNHATAYSIINYILTTAQPLPWGVYRVKADDTTERLAAHPLYDLLYRPNPRQSWAELKTQLQGYLLTTGNAYVYGVRPSLGSKAGRKAELWALPAPLVEIEGGGWMQEVAGYKVPNGQGGYTRFEAADVLHLRYWNPDDSKYGLSPVAAGIDTITAAKAGLTSRVRQYQNQGPAGILWDKTSTEPWSPEQAQGVRSWWRRFLPGGRQSGELPIVGGELGYTQLGLSPVDLDVLAAIPHDKDAVADLFRFPGQLLNGSKGTTFSNMGEAGAALYSRCVIPLETMIRDGLNRWLGADYGDGVYIDFDTSHIPELQPNKEKLAAWLASAWWVSTQDKQRMMGVEVDDTLPRYLVPASLVDPQAVPPAPDDAEAQAEAAAKWLARQHVNDYR
ncbi:phage portal protein [Hymenobacter coalescens]